MLTSYSIKTSLTIQDENITLMDFRQEKLKNLTVNAYHGKLSYGPPECPTCQKIMLKNGFKTSRISLLESGGYKTVLYLDKQRFLCPHCHLSLMAQTSLVKPEAFISQAVKRKIFQLLREKISLKLIAQLTGVSITTVMRVLDTIQLSPLTTLASVLGFDETKVSGNSLSFVMSNGLEHKLLDILEFRDLKHLKDYFFQFPRKVRQAVKFISIDMYAPYMTLIQSLFPNAKIVIDRFQPIRLGALAP